MHFVRGDKTELKDKSVNDIKEGNTLDLLAATAANEKGHKFRYQPLAIVNETYTVHWPHPSPPSLRLQINNVQANDFLMMGLCYPTGTSNFRIQRGSFMQRVPLPVDSAKKNAVSLKPASSKEELTRDSFFFDSSSRLLWIKMDQKSERQDHWNYCPQDGCETLWIEADVPQGSAQESGQCFSALSA